MVVLFKNMWSCNQYTREKLLVSINFVVHFMLNYFYLRNQTFTGPRKQFRSCRNEASINRGLYSRVCHVALSPLHAPMQPCREPVDLRAELCSTFNDSNHTYTPLNGISAHVSAQLN